jgi:hypothetical protein
MIEIFHIENECLEVLLPLNRIELASVIEFPSDTAALQCKCNLSG